MLPLMSLHHRLNCPLYSLQSLCQWSSMAFKSWIIMLVLSSSFIQGVRMLGLERPLTVLYKYYCLEAFSLGMFCFLSCFYLDLSVNDLLPVDAPSGSPVRAFPTPHPTPSPVYGLDPWLSAPSHWLLMGSIASLRTDRPPKHSHTCTLILCCS